MMHHSSIIDRMMTLATKAHAGQIDRDGLPHIFHCMRVAMKQGSDRAFIIGILHDVIEDCGIQWLCGGSDEFPAGIVPAVELLTRSDGESYNLYIERIIRSGDFDVMNVKKADIEDNTRIERVDSKATEKFPMYKEAHEKICEALGIQSDLSMRCQEH